MKDIYLLGGGKYSLPLAELAMDNGYDILGIYDDSAVESEFPLLGKINDLNCENVRGRKFAIAIGNNKIREQIAFKVLKYGGILPTLIHSTAYISPTAAIGQGVYIQPHAVIWSRVTVDDFCIISPNAVVAHHSSIGRASLISTGANIGANIDIKQYNFIGINATVITGIHKVGINNVIGAGAVVIRDIEDNNVLAGIPARVIKPNK